MTSSNSLASLAWFLLIVAAIPLALWLIKRSPMGGRYAAGPGQTMRTVGVLSLSPNQRVVTVEVGQGEDRRWLVLGVTAQQISTLHTMPPQAAAPSAATPVAPFAQLLGALRKPGPRAADGSDGA